jgi:hypothetical protein
LWVRITIQHVALHTLINRQLCCILEGVIKCAALVAECIPGRFSTAAGSCHAATYPKKLAGNFWGGLFSNGMLQRGWLQFGLQHLWRVLQLYRRVQCRLRQNTALPMQCGHCIMECCTIACWAALCIAVRCVTVGCCSVVHCKSRSIQVRAAC